MSNETLLEPVHSLKDVEMTKAAQRCIMAALDHSNAAKIVLLEEGQPAEQAPTIELPPQALRAIADLLGLMAQQQPIMLMPQKHELTTQEAAAMLNVSRPFVIKQIENGTLSCKKVGRHRRIKFQDLMQYKVKIQQQTGKALDDLSTLSREMGLEY
jgi:excisionase family DNA binding protein